MGVAPEALEEAITVSQGVARRRLIHPNKSPGCNLAKVTGSGLLTLAS
jgi:hypothetical protein